MAFSSASALHATSSSAGQRQRWHHVKQLILNDMYARRVGYKLMAKSDMYLSERVFEYFQEYHFDEVEYIFEELHNDFKAEPNNVTMALLNYCRFNIDIFNDSSRPLTRHVLQMVAYKMYTCYVHLYDNFIVDDNEYSYFCSDAYDSLIVELDKVLPYFKAQNVFAVAYRFAKNYFRINSNGGITISRLANLPTAMPAPIKIKNEFLSLVENNNNDSRMVDQYHNTRLETTVDLSKFKIPKRMKPVVLLERCNAAEHIVAQAKAMSPISKKLKRYEKYFTKTVLKSPVYEHLRAYPKQYEQLKNYEDIVLREKLIKLVYLNCRQTELIAKYALKI